MGCRRRASPAELVRLARRPGGDLAVGPGHPGRGAWVCPDPACVDRAAARGALRRALRGDVRPEAIEDLRRSLDPARSAAPRQA